jgi:hypothetical protein
MNAIARRAELACRLAELLRLADRWQTEHPVGAARRVREQADGEE